MSDDIVTGLRELAIGALYGINIAPFEYYNAAADEIERLRELLWGYENCELVTESPCDPDWDGGECDTCAKHRNAAVPHD